MLRSVLVALLLAVAIPANAGVASSLEKFFSAWSAGDPRAVTAWVEASPERVVFVREYERLRATRCVRLHDLAIENVVERGDVATARVRALLTKSSAMPGGREWRERYQATVTLHRVAGEWKIASMRQLEDELAERLTALKSQDARLALLRSCDTLRTPRLAHELMVRGIERFNQSRHADARGLLALIDELERELDDDATRGHQQTLRSTLASYPNRDGSVLATSAALEAIAAAERHGDPDILARALVRHGRARTDVDWEEGVPSFQRVMAIADYVQDRGLVARAATQLAYYSDINARHIDALRYSEIAWRDASTTDDIVARMSALRNLGGAYATQGDFELAKPHFEESLRLAREAQFPQMTRDLLAHLAYCYAIDGDLPKALRANDEALALGPDDTLAAVYLSRADIYSVFPNKAAQIEDAIFSAIRKAWQARDTTVPFVALRQLAGLRTEQKRYQEALAIYDELLCWRGGEEIEDLGHLRAVALRRTGRLQEAAAMLERIAEVSVPNPASRPFGLSVKYFLLHDRTAAAFLEYADLLVDLGKPEKAYLTTQRFRSRALLEAVARENPPLTSIMTPAQLEEYRARERRVSELNKAVAQNETPALRAELSAARIAATDFAARLRGAHDAAYSNAIETPVPKELPQIPEDTAVIEYVVTKERAIIFTLTRGKDGATVVNTTVVPLGILALRQKVDDFVARIERRDQGYRIGARELYKLLVAPATAAGGAKTLCIVPHQDLWRLPFHALLMPNGKHLSEERSVFYAPSATMLQIALRKRQPEAELLAIANPAIRSVTATAFRSRNRGAELGPLPDSEVEVRELARIYGTRDSRIYIGEAAREAAFKDEAGRYRVLHIATHGILDGRSPMFSSLLMAADDLTEDGMLEAREIANLSLSADVAVLAACDTARGRISPGEGVIGMSWALLVAGCPNAVVSQWKAESAATARLMVEFHRQLVAGKPLATAMQGAQRALMADSRYAHPFYWAPFVVVGSGRPGRSQHQ